MLNTWNAYIYICSIMLGLPSSDIFFKIHLFCIGQWRSCTINRIYMYITLDGRSRDQGPVVQSVVSLTSSLVVKMLTVLVSTISNSEVRWYFCWKNVSSFCKCKSYSHFFSKNFSAFAIFIDQSFNDMLTKDIVSFEQLSPEVCYIYTCINRWMFTDHSVTGRIQKFQC